MNTYLVPIWEDKAYIKKIVANSERQAAEKLYQYFYNKYESLEGDSLDEIMDQLSDIGVDYGKIYEIEDFT